jgi:hypothetical protein
MDLLYPAREGDSILMTPKMMLTFSEDDPDDSMEIWAKPELPVISEEAEDAASPCSPRVGVIHSTPVEKFDFSTFVENDDDVSLLPNVNSVQELTLDEMSQLVYSS